MDCFTQHRKPRSTSPLLRYKEPPACGRQQTYRIIFFLWYLRINQHLLAKPMEQLINDNTLIAALLVAESKPEQKGLMIRLAKHFVMLAD